MGFVQFGRRRIEAAEGEQTLVLDGPLDSFPASEVHGLRDGRREVDVPLLAGLAFDELDFSREAHSQLSSQTTRYHKTSRITTEKRKNVLYLVKGQTPGASFARLAS